MGRRKKRVSGGHIEEKNKKKGRGFLLFGLL